MSFLLAHLATAVLAYALTRVILHLIPEEK